MTTPVTSAGGGTNTSIFSGGSGGSSGNGITSDFETFLKMLTTQARYQDPLEPLDSQEYASQLAQFSMVEQQVQSNDLLTSMQTQLNLSAMATMTQWVGMEARVAVDGQYDGASPINVAPGPLASADNVRLVIRDASGETVDNILLPVSAEPFDWKGVDKDGNQLPAGTYSFTLESYRGDELLLEEKAEIYTQIRETQLQGNQVLLILGDGSAVPSSQVTALREPSVG